MSFIKPDFNKLKQLSPKDINNYIKNNYSVLSFEDYSRLIKLKKDITELNKNIISGFLKSKVMSMALKQTYKEIPEALLLTEQEKKNNPRIWNDFKDKLFLNAKKIICYTEKSKGLEKRRAKKNKLTK